MTEGLGICAPETLKSVTKGDFETAVSNILGTNYGAFAENNKALTYAEVVEALVKLLGYEAYAEAHGGIMAMATQIDLTKGLSPEEYIRGGEPVTEAQLLSAPVLLEGGKPKGQLVVYEVNGEDKITELKTAVNAENCTNANAPDEGRR